MKKALVSAAMVGAVIIGGNCLLPVLVHSRPDAGEAKRQLADKIMTEVYGKNWMERLDYTNTNKTQLRGMTDLYEAIIGYRPAKEKGVCATTHI